ncbi:hypothetical protein F6X68_26025 [Micromonospora sp. AMSO12t]|uniref:hypothetical protein n=1 Tax=unclassified Micromonospora TaxID=2617518 RepID=UPI00124B0439|nr:MULTISPECIES: hypothetical protein [unclassified Micromonospora]KAB1138653.1 hypothetical protein F6X68_26025 [Micromonospora sp. AMSO12t]WSG02799.1 hypothetical protein OG989_03445 [Micromonospora sp. NBC_01740]
MAEEVVPGHADLIGFRLPDGTLSTDAAAPATTVGYRAGCSCGWVGASDYPAAEEGRWMAASEWGGHIRPILAATPPGWLMGRSDTLRDNVAELATTWPLQALGILAEVERWQRPLIERAVVSAREAGLSWAEIGNALGISRQSAHERFRNLAPPKPPA